MVEINDGDHDQGTKKGEEVEILKGEAELQEQEKGRQGRDPLDEGILHRDGPLAIAALSAEQGVADQGNVVVSPDRILALGAMRSGTDDRFIFRQPVDTDIEEAPDDGPKNN
jgi:hypothetical protein